MGRSNLVIAVIGAGRWGPNLIRNFQTHSDCKVKHVVDVDADRLRVIHEYYENIQTTTDWEAVLEDPEVDTVIVASPTITHYGIVKKALLLKKDVFVEKPLTNNFSEAQELNALAKENGLKLMVGHVFLFNSAVQKMKEIIDSKELGDLFYCYSIRTNLGPIRGDVNALWDLAAHDISIVLYLFGMAPESVSGFGASFINPPKEDVAFARMQFPRGTFANFHVSWLDPKKVRQMVIVGSQKMLVFDDMVQESPIRIFDKNVSHDVTKSAINDTMQKFRKGIIEGKISTPEVLPCEPLKNECSAFVDWVLRDKSQPSDGLFGVKVVQTLEAMMQSMEQQGMTVTLNS